MVQILGLCVRISALHSEVLDWASFYITATLITLISVP